MWISIWFLLFWGNIVNNLFQLRVFDFEIRFSVLFVLFFVFLFFSNSKHIRLLELIILVFPALIFLFSTIFYHFQIPFFLFHIPSQIPSQISLMWWFFPFPFFFFTFFFRSFLFLPFTFLFFFLSPSFLSSFCPS